MEAIDQLIVTLGQRLKQAKQAKRLFADDLALLHRMALTIGHDPQSDHANAARPGRAALGILSACRDGCLSARRARDLTRIRRGTTCRAPTTPLPSTASRPRGQTKSWVPFQRRPRLRMRWINLGYGRPASEAGHFHALFTNTMPVFLMNSRPIVLLARTRSVSAS